MTMQRDEIIRLDLVRLVSLLLALKRPKKYMYPLWSNEKDLENVDNTSV